MERLTVELGARSYDILIGDGLLADIGAQVAPLLNRRRTMIVTDAHVAGPYLDRVSATLVAEGVSVSSLVLQIGRAHVELQSLMRISYAVFCLKKKHKTYTYTTATQVHMHILHMRSPFSS